MITHRRAARREREAAELLGTKRVRRRRGERAPDVLPLRLPNGDAIQAEVKSGMRRVPRSIAKALEQAEGYAPDAIPLAVFSDVGGAAIACMPLREFARLLGLQPERLGVQLPLLGVNHAV